jgi:hypothetical protein
MNTRPLALIALLTVLCSAPLSGQSSYTEDPAITEEKAFFDAGIQDACASAEYPEFRAEHAAMCAFEDAKSGEHTDAHTDAQLNDEIRLAKLQNVIDAKSVLDRDLVVADSLSRVVQIDRSILVRDLTALAIPQIIAIDRSIIVRDVASATHHMAQMATDRRSLRTACHRAYVTSAVNGCK